MISLQSTCRWAHNGEKKKRKKEEEKNLHVFKGLNQLLGNVELFFHIYLSDLSGSTDPSCDVKF